MFAPVHGASLWIHAIVALLFCAVVFVLLQFTPKQARKYIILGVTFLGGLFFALEFFLPVHALPQPDDPTFIGNWLSPFKESVSDWLVVVGTFTVGLGVINLSMVHFKRLTKGGENAFTSAVFFISMIVMAFIGILQNAHPNAINKNLNEILFSGALTTLDATMFSIIAFYIVSASYRAFRVKSTEATILLVTAVVVMLGQISVGQYATSWIPKTGMMSVLHFEEVRQWILTLANTAAVRAIGFGLGIGALAVALRIWLGLERGSYFDSQN